LVKSHLNPFRKWIFHLSMLSNSKRTALKYCANWNKEKCLGVLFSIKRKRKSGHIYPVNMNLDEKKSGKDCNPDNCSYFKNCVIAGIPEI